MANEKSKAEQYRDERKARIAEAAKKNSTAVWESAAGFGADCIITACPLCRYNLIKNGSGAMPVVYFTELLAEALGVKEEIAND